MRDERRRRLIAEIASPAGPLELQARLPWQRAALRWGGGPRLRPSQEALLAAELSTRQQPTLAREVLFLVLASATRTDLLRAIDRTWCGSHHRGIECWAYLDSELQTLRTRVQLEAMRLVPASEYTILEHKPHESCCDRNVRAAEWSGSGPVDHFCGAHVRHTLPSQYRFLPALAHARRTHWAELASGAKKWMVLVDDDSWVSLPKLLGLFAQLNHSMAVQLGDFIPPQQNATHWTRPFACGGAGTVLSRAAALATDFGACARRFAGTCMQSDWMIAFCLGGGVTPLRQYGCSACATRRSGRVHQLHDYVLALREALLERRCHFAQYTMPMERFLPPHNVLAQYAFTMPAIQHHASGHNHGVAPEQRSVWATDRSPFFSLCSGAHNASTSTPGGAPNASWPKLVLVIGSQKAATTSLHSLLTAHPAFCKSPRLEGDPHYFVKEKHFFDEPSRCERGIDWYVNNFLPERTCRYVDATPYIGQPTDEVRHAFALATATRVYYTVPFAALENTRLIVLLREPADRLRSWHSHLTRVAHECDTSKCAHYSCGAVWSCVGRHYVIPRSQQLLPPFWTAEKVRALDAHGWGTYPRLRRDQGACVSACFPQFDHHNTACVCLPAKSGPGWPDNMPMREWLSVYGANAVLSGVYAPQLELWRRYFGASLMVGNYHDFETEEGTRELVERLAQHAGLGSSRGMAEAMPRVHSSSLSSGGCTLPCDINVRLLDYYSPHNKVLYAAEPELRQFTASCCSDVDPRRMTSIALSSRFEIKQANPASGWTLSARKAGSMAHDRAGGAAAAAVTSHYKSGASLRAAAAAKGMRSVMAQKQGQRDF